MSNQVSEIGQVILLLFASGASLRGSLKDWLIYPPRFAIDDCIIVLITFEPSVVPLGMLVS